jgi:thiamine biosynthesis lipoprotein
MKETRLLMGMPVMVEIIDRALDRTLLEKVFDHFAAVDETFSTYKEGSEISRINRGVLSTEAYSADMKEIFRLAEQTKGETSGYFDIRTPLGVYDPSGIVKGWAIGNAARILEKEGCEHFYVDAGGDIQTRGMNSVGKPWRVGIKNPFNTSEIIKVLELKGEGVATSGTYLRGRHIYDPHEKKPVEHGIVSLTVIADTVYDADRFATAAFAMGEKGIHFIEHIPRCEGYMVDAEGIATLTRGFHKFVVGPPQNVNLIRLRKSYINQA